MLTEHLTTTHKGYRRGFILVVSACGVILATGLSGCSGAGNEDVVETEPVEVRPPKAVE